MREGLIVTTLGARLPCAVGGRGCVERATVTVGKLGLGSSWGQPACATCGAELLARAIRAAVIRAGGLR